MLNKTAGELYIQVLLPPPSTSCSDDDYARANVSTLLKSPLSALAARSLAVGSARFSMPLRVDCSPASLRRCWTPWRSVSSVETVVFQSMQASVTDWPYVRLAGPVAGIDCLPSTRCDSICGRARRGSGSGTLTRGGMRGRRTTHHNAHDVLARLGRAELPRNVLGDDDLALVLLAAVAVRAAGRGGASSALPP